MAGIYLKNEKAYLAFSKWLSHALRLRGEICPLTVHTSAFLEKSISKRMLLIHSIEMYQELADEITNRDFIGKIKPMLVIPLGYSKNLSTWENGLRLDKQMSDEPPSLYLIEETIFPEIVEEYIAPINLIINHQLGLHCSTYYRCFRDSMAIINDWEFCKAIYFEPLHK